jgi:hypothetical protein
MKHWRPYRRRRRKRNMSVWDANAQYRNSNEFRVAIEVEENV